MSEILNMGGYAFYVWTSYFLTLLVVIINTVGPIVCERKKLAQLKRQARRRES